MGQHGIEAHFRNGPAWSVAQGRIWPRNWAGRVRIAFSVSPERRAFEALKCLEWVQWLEAQGSSSPRERGRRSTGLSGDWQVDILEGPL